MLVVSVVLIFLGVLLDPLELFLGLDLGFPHLHQLLLGSERLQLLLFPLQIELFGLLLALELGLGLWIQFGIL